MARLQHNLTPEQKQIFAGLAQRMTWFSGLVVTGSLLGFVINGYELAAAGVVGNEWIASLVIAAISAAIYIAIALLTLSAATTVRALVSNRDDDVPQLVEAMRSLKRLFGVQYWLIMISLLTVIGGMFLLLLWVTLRA